MTVEQLIEALREYPGHWSVVASFDDAEGFPFRDTVRHVADAGLAVVELTA